MRDSESAQADLGAWVLRGGAALFFILMGMEKFSSDPRGQWVQMFDQIGMGQWFRYLTGVVEVLGGILFLFPRSCFIGAAMLACTMVGAMIVHIFIRGSIGASIVPGILLAIVAIALGGAGQRPRRRLR